MPAPLRYDINRMLDMWAAGALARDIHKATGIPFNSIYPYVSDARLRGDLRAVRRQGIPTVSRTKILDMWASGASAKKIARASGRTVVAIYSLIYVARLAGEPRAALRYQKRPPSDVPCWVPASLRSTYRNKAARAGEEAAASHVRRLKAEMARAGA